MSMIDRTYFFSKVTVNGNAEPDYLDTNILDMELPTLTKVKIGYEFEGRPDFLAFKYFGSYNLGWLICLHNDFLDPIEDFYIGRIIKIPDLESYYRYYNANARSD